jgi:cytidine deaminase
MRNTTYEELTALQQQALDASLKVLDNSYDPYSHFAVGATLMAASGELISGTNFENSAYGSTICAERAAVLRANAAGIRNFTGIAIIAKGESSDTTEVTGPCGSCRQVLYELAQIAGGIQGDLEVILSTTKKDKIVLTSIRELLPLGFGPCDLGVDISKYQKR